MTGPYSTSQSGRGELSGKLAHPKCGSVSFQHNSKKVDEERPTRSEWRNDESLTTGATTLSNHASGRVPFSGPLSLWMNAGMSSTLCPIESTLRNIVWRFRVFARSCHDTEKQSDMPVCSRRPSRRFFPVISSLFCIFGATDGDRSMTPTASQPWSCSVRRLKACTALPLHRPGRRLPVQFHRHGAEFR